MSALGFSITEEKLLEIGERIVKLERLYNVREGMGRQDDYLPRRFTSEPLPLLANETDPGTGETDLSGYLRSGQLFDFDAMLDRYYKIRSWDAKVRPLMATLERLSLSEEGKKVIF